MNIIRKPDFEFQLCERNNGKKFIKVLLEINDANGFIEVARINPSKNYWTEDGYGDMEEVYLELSKNSNLTELLSKVNPLFPNPLFSRRKIEAENKRLREALEFYASRENYQADVVNQWEPVVAVDKDAGNIARKALEETV